MDLIKRSESSIAIVGKKIAITNKLLSISNDNRFIEFFINLPDMVGIIPLNYSLDEELLYKYTWNWSGLSANPNLNWRENFIRVNSEKWDWYCLIQNKGIKWSEDFILELEKKEYVSLRDFSCCETITWTEDLIDKYTKRSEWFWDWQALSNNPSLPWDINFFEKYLEKWDWSCDGLSSNPNLPWSIDFIEKYKNRWDWTCLSRNEGLPWNIELVERFLPHWEYLGLLGNNSLTEDLNPIVKKINLRSIGKEEEFNRYSKIYKNIGYWIENYKNNEIDEIWDFLSNNIHIIWTPEILYFYRLNWGWGGLSENEGLPWSLELLETYRHMWDFRFIIWNRQIWDSVFKANLNDMIIDRIMKHYISKTSKITSKT